VFEFADVNVERCTAQMIALERVGEPSSSTISPRATLTSTPPAFIAAKQSLSKRRVLSAVHWQQITTKSR
jgi:hypothetical protein